MNITGFRKRWEVVSACHKSLIYVVLLVLAGALAYANSLNVPFILDDVYTLDYIGKQDLLHHLLSGSSRRIADISFTLNYRMHGMQVFGYHLINLAVHLVTAILIFFVVKAAISVLIDSYCTEKAADHETSFIEQYLPVTVAMLFVCHPVQTQAVTYIIQRYTSMATLFYMLATLCFINARIVLEQQGVTRKVVLLSCGVVISGAAAFGCKQIAATLPVTLIALEYFLFRGRLINRRFVIICSVLFMFVLVLLLIKWRGSSLDFILIDLKHATSEDPHASRVTYFLTQTRVVATYLRLLILPVGLNILPDSPIYTSLYSTPVMLFLSLHVLIVAIAVKLFITSCHNLDSTEWLHGIYQRLAALGIVWFYITMAVESSIIPIQDVIFEHRIYLPSIGFFLAVTACAGLLAQSLKHGKRAAWTLLVVVCLLLVGMTIARNNIWNDSLQLWQDAARKSPNKYLAQANLAGEYLDRKMPDKALPYLVRAMELNPSMYIKTKTFIGIALKEMKLYGSRFTTGEEYIVAGGPNNSGTLEFSRLSQREAVIYNNLGLAYEYLNNPAKALQSYRISLNSNPEYDLALYNLALLAARLGDKDLYSETLHRLQAVRPTLAKSLIN